MRAVRAAGLHKLGRVPLKLIHGPPNSGRAGRIRRALTAVLDREPVLVVPNVDDVDRFQGELCAEGAVLGAEVTTFDGLFRAVATAGGAPPRPGLTPAQRLGAVAAAVAEQRPGLRPLRGSASQPGFPVALEQLLDELQGAGLEPAAVEAEAGTLEGSAYLGDVSTLFAGYAAVRDRLGLADRHAVARGAIELLGAGGAEWWSRPVFIYGFDDLTRNQLDLIRALAAVAEVTVALPHESGNAVLEERTAPLLESLEEIGIDDAEELDADPANTPDAPLLFHLERGFGAAEPERMPPDDGLVLLRSAGERGEAEAIAAEVARLLADGVEPEEIAIVVRDPGPPRPAARVRARVLRRPGRARGGGLGRDHGGRRLAGRAARGAARHRQGGRPAALPARPLRRPAGTGRLVRAQRPAHPHRDRHGRARALGGAVRRAPRRRGAGARGRRAPRRARRRDRRDGGGDGRADGLRARGEGRRGDLHLAGRARRARGPRAHIPTRSPRRSRRSSSGSGTARSARG